MYTKERRFNNIKVIKFQEDFVIMYNQKGEKGKMSKEEFDKNFEKTNGYNLYKIKPESEKMAKEKLDFLSKMLPNAMAAKVGNKMGDMAMLGSQAQKYCEEFKCSIAECMKDFQEYQKIATESMINGGVHFMKPHDVPQHLKKNNWVNKENIDKERQNKPKNDTMSIGDLLKAKENKYKEKKDEKSS